MKELWLRTRKWLREPGMLRNVHLSPFAKNPTFLCAVGLVLLVGLGAFAYFYHKYAMMIEDKFGGGAIRTSSSVYAMPRQIFKGDRLSEAELIARLQRAGYTEDSKNKVGYYQRTPDGIVITTGPNSYFQPHTAVVRIAGDHINNIVSRTENRGADHYWLEPELITNLYDGEREKR